MPIDPAIGQGTAGAGTSSGTTIQIDGGSGDGADDIEMIGSLTGPGPGPAIATGKEIDVPEMIQRGEKKVEKKVIDVAKVLGSRDAEGFDFESYEGSYQGELRLRSFIMHRLRMLRICLSEGA